MSQRNEKWEYRVEHCISPLAEEYLNELGSDGWELVAAMPTAEHCIFKRIAPDLQDEVALEQREALDQDGDAGNA